MPAENEIKFVLFFDLSEDMLADQQWKFKSIPRQGYIPPAATIKEKGGDHLFRYRLQIPGKDREVALEKRISKADYKDLFAKASHGKLPKEGRVREYGDKFMFTYKQWSERTNCDTEIEMPISEEDFEDLFSQNTRYLTKHRYYHPEVKKSECDWSVDFLLDANGRPYFILAEVEMPEGEEEPDFIPKIIKPYIAYRVPKGDKDFSNKMLADQDHARKMLEQIGVINPQNPTHEI